MLEIKCDGHHLKLGIIRKWEQKKMATVTGDSNKTCWQPVSSILLKKLLKTATVL
ncbi:UNVERIFIED_CONTAM: hypothetical protein FKN15_045325 [Acipenser sinensis]